MVYEFLGYLKKGPMACVAHTLKTYYTYLCIWLIFKSDNCILTYLSVVWCIASLDFVWERERGYHSHHDFEIFRVISDVKNSCAKKNYVLVVDIPY